MARQADQGRRAVRQAGAQGRPDDLVLGGVVQEQLALEQLPAGLHRLAAGRVVRGEMRAGGESVVAASLRRRGILATRIKKQTLPRGRRISAAILINLLVFLCLLTIFPISYTLTSRESGSLPPRALAPPRFPNAGPVSAGRITDLDPIEGLQIEMQSAAGRMRHRRFRQHREPELGERVEPSGAGAF